MKTAKILSILFLTIILTGCAGEPAKEKNGQKNTPQKEQEKQTEKKSECKKAGGTLVPLKECDGSINELCIISGKERCYADQIENGKCPKGEFKSRVVCDTEKKEDKETAEQK